MGNAPEGEAEDTLRGVDSYKNAFFLFNFNWSSTSGTLGSEFLHGHNQFQQPIKLKHAQAAKSPYFTRQPRVSLPSPQLSPSSKKKVRT